MRGLILLVLSISCSLAWAGDPPPSALDLALEPLQARLEAAEGPEAAWVILAPLLARDVPSAEAVQFAEFCVLMAQFGRATDRLAEADGLLVRAAHLVEGRSESASSRLERLTTHLQVVTALKDMKRTINLARRVLALTSTEPQAHAETIGDAQLALASALRARGDHLEAAPHWKVAIEALRARTQGDDLRLAFALAGYGSTLDQLDRLEPARDALLEATQMFRRLGFDIDQRAHANLWLAKVHQQLGDYGLAQRHFQIAYDRYVALRGADSSAALHTAVALNRLRLEAGLYREALAGAEQIAKVDADVVKRPGKGLDAEARVRLHTQVAFSRYRLEDTPGAAAAAERALGEFSGDKDSHMYASLWHNVAFQWGRDGQHAKALDGFQRARKIFEEGDPHAIPLVLAEIAETQLFLGQTDAAEATIQEALERLEATERPLRPAEIYWRYALFQRAADRPTVAIFFLHKAVDAAQTGRAQIQQMGALAGAAYAESNRHIYELLAETLIDAGRLAEAQQALALIKQEEQADFERRPASRRLRHRWARPARDARELSWSARYAEAAGGLAAAGRAYAKLREIQRTAAREGLPFSTASVQQLAALRVRLGAARKRYVAALGRIESELVDAGEARAVGERGLRRLSALQSTLGRLGDGVVLVHYLVAPTRLHILVTTRSAQIVRSMSVDRAELSRVVHRMRQAVGSPGQPVATASAALYAHLIAPIRADLEAAGARTLMLSLDGVLRYAPMAALWDPARRRYLVEDFAIVGYSEAARNSLERRAETPWRFAGLGVPDPPAGYPPLPAVTAELERIAKRGPDDPDGVMPGRIWLNEAFDRAALQTALASGAAVVHIASHFAFHPGADAASYLLLGGGDRLTVAELRDGAFDFAGVRLLTLSACETALSAGADGAEVEGLATLAQNRGAQSVLATLWPVADSSTARFMETLYRGLVEGADKARALRKAQLAFIHSAEQATGIASRRIVRDDAAAPVLAPAGLSHPYYWAPFILTGNWL